MNEDWISRQAAIDAILGCCTSDFDNEYECGYDDGLRQGVHKLKHLPSAQPEPKKGKWINRSLNIVYPEWERYKCSACGGFSHSYEFCPHCGADMRGEEHE